MGSNVHHPDLRGISALVQVQPALRRMSPVALPVLEGVSPRLTDS